MCIEAWSNRYANNWECLLDFDSTYYNVENHCFDFCHIVALHKTQIKEGKIRKSFSKIKNRQACALLVSLNLADQFLFDFVALSTFFSLFLLIFAFLVLIAAANYYISNFRWKHGVNSGFDCLLCSNDVSVPFLPLNSGACNK